MIHDYDALKSNVLSGHIGPRDADVAKVLLSEVDTLRELVWDLMTKVRNAPCMASHPGELTYHCNPERVCRVCEWRDEVDSMLHSEWSMPDGLWSSPNDVEMATRKEES